MNKIHLIYLALIVFTFQNCTSPADEQNRTDPFDGLPVLEVGKPLDITDEQAADSGEFFFTSGYFRDMAIDGDGNLLVGNSGQRMIHQFDGNGIFQGTIGSEGEGPGEFQSIVYFDTVADTLYALDSRPMRVSIFTRMDGGWQFHHAFNMEPKEGYSIENIYSLASGRLLLDYATDFRQMLSMADQDTQFTRVLELRTSSGEMIDDYFLTVRDEEQFMYSSDGGGGVLSTLPYGAPSIFDIGPDNQIHYLYGSDFRIRIFDINGAVTDSIVHPTFKAEISDEIKKAEQEELSIGMGNDQQQREMEQQYLEEIPSYGPALRDMHVDRETGQVIVRRHTFDGEPNWMLLDREGNRAGVFHLDEDMQVFDFRDGKIIGSLRREEMLPMVRVVNLSI